MAGQRGESQQDRLKVAVVTGAASGIGAATAKRLAEDGWAVVAVDMDNAVKEVAREHEAISACVADISQASGNQAMVEAAIDRHGRIDGLVLNAGVGSVGNLDQTAIEELDRLYAVNVRGVALGIQAALPALRQTTGAVSVTCSVSGLGADTDMWAYNTSKGGTANLIRAAAWDLGPEGIRVNGVCPGPTAGTAMTNRLKQNNPELFEAMRRSVPLQRWCQPMEQAAAHAFLLSAAASYITGVLLPVDGGITAGSGSFLPRPRS
jgi:NAD(P)-dependent dehydrogenase (short-subunit alcohol dehydrogenase family)